MTRAITRSDVDRFYASLSGRARLKLYAAIFFLMAPVGLLSSWRPGEDRSPWLIAAHVALSGFGAAAAAAAIIHNIRLLLLVIPVHALAYMALERFDPSFPGAVGGAAILLIGAGYSFFISFVSGEGVSKLRLQTEMVLAQGIHRDLVPAIDATGPPLELCGRSTPSSEVGGDLMDVVERDGRTVVCVADVVGHGVAAGVVMGMVKSALRTRLLGDDRDGALLGDLDGVMAGMLRPGLFVTCLLVVIEENRAAYANAGHLPLLRYDARSGCFERLSDSGLPLGAGVRPRGDAADLHGWHAFEFRPGDLLVLLTDGLTEVMDPAGEELGLDPLEAVIARDPRAPLATLCERLGQAARRHGPQADDQTVLLVRRPEPGTRPVLR